MCEHFGLLSRNEALYSMDNLSLFLHSYNRSLSTVQEHGKKFSKEKEKKSASVKHLQKSGLTCARLRAYMRAYEAFSFLAVSSQVEAAVPVAISEG